MDSSTKGVIEELKICAHVHCREVTTQVCNGCHNTPDATLGHVYSVWYCSVKCQKNDWRFHKDDCKKAQARRSLYRVAETAKLAYFRLVERTFDLDIVGVETKGDTLYVREGPKERSISNPFPSKHLNSKQGKQAVMAWMNVASSQHYVQDLVEVMLQDIPFKAAEVVIPKVNYVRRVVIIEHDGNESDSSQSEHVILKITINEDEDYALDITGAQLGFYDPITPWKSYQQAHIETPGKIRSLKNLRDSNRLSSKETSSENALATTRKTLNRQFAKAFSSASKSWQQQNESFSAMLNLKDETFHTRQRELLEFIDERLAAKKKAAARSQGSLIPRIRSLRRRVIPINGSAQRNSQTWSNVS